MHATDRTQLSAVISTLTRAGFKAAVLSGRDRRKGFAARYLGRGMGVIPAVYLHNYFEPTSDDFARACAALIEAGYKLEDCSPARGGEYVKFGCARVLKV